MDTFFQKELIAWFVIFMGAITALLYTFSFINQTGVTAFDNLNISELILGIFLLALAINCVNVLRLYLEQKNIRKESGLLKQHWDYISKSAVHNRDVSQDFSIDVISNQLARRETIVYALSGILTTLGMIGTIFGLIRSLSGLSDVMGIMSSNLQNSENSLESSPEIAKTLDLVFSGMSDAFSTTILGAIFGGILLRLLHSSTINMSEILIDLIKVKTEIELLGYLQKSKNSRDESIVLNSYTAVLEMVEAIKYLQDLITNLQYKISLQKEELEMQSLLKSIRNAIYIFSFMLMICFALLAALVVK